MGIVTSVLGNLGRLSLKLAGFLLRHGIPYYDGKYGYRVNVLL